MRILLHQTRAGRRLALRRAFEGRGHEVLIAGPEFELDPATSADAAVLDADDAELLTRFLESVAGTIGVVLLGDHAIESFPGQLIAQFDADAPVDSIVDAVELSQARAASIEADERGLVHSGGLAALEEGILLLAASDLPVLVHGESGSGKEVVARELHLRGPRAAEPFVAVACGAIPDDLIESTLFGHERGAFTDAAERHRGSFERAGQGTLFLDEIGELPISVQATLLRVLQERSFERVGGHEKIILRARIVSATHRDLHARTRSGEFREDLLHRVAGSILRIPSLRDRPEDLPALATVLLKRAHPESVVPILTGSAIERLRGHDWPGNVRELDNVLQRASLRSTTAEISRDQVEAALAEGPRLDPDRTLEAALNEWIAARRRAGHTTSELQLELRAVLERSIDTIRGVSGGDTFWSIDSDT